MKVPFTRADELRKKYIDFFVEKDHKQLPSVSLIPEDDPTILFTPAGMSPLVRYLMGEVHPLGKRLCSVQKCVRTDDIEEVGDLTHFTFFEMLGNWSLGDYFKNKAIELSFEFLTAGKWLGFDHKKIYVSVFEGDKDAPRDAESIEIWKRIFKKVGIETRVKERIFSYPKKDNWWGPAGQVGPCGPSTEMFYDTGRPHNKKFGEYCHPNCGCGRFVEIWNDVFMEYYKKPDASFELLKQKNVDTGLGLERLVSLTEWLDKKIKTPDPFLTALFKPVVETIEQQSGKNYSDFPKEFRIICDHLRAAVFIISDGVEPSNKDRGYILRRLLRRAVFYGKHFLQISNPFAQILAGNFVGLYGEVYKELKNNQFNIYKVVEKEEERFFWTINHGLHEFEKIKDFSGRTAFYLYESFGFPLELSLEEARKRDIFFNEEDVVKEFKQELKRHQKLSRRGMKQKFSGGLQDQSPKVIRLHTATHLLHEALRRVLGNDVQQAGSNITQERLRFDFSCPKKMTEEEKKQVEDLVNKQIKKNLKVKFETMTLIEAKKQKALAFFGQQYPNRVKVYSIGTFSKEVCVGPHVDFTGLLGRFKIIKEETSGAGKRRIYAQVQ